MPTLLSDEMTQEDWDRFAADFENRYNEHLRSIKNSSPRRVGKSTGSRYYYDEDDGLGSLLPTTEELDRMRKQLGMDEHYNIACAVYSMTRSDEDTMASYFLENCF
jgi:hypothetical protein